MTILVNVPHNKQSKITKKLQAKHI